MHRAEEQPELVTSCRTAVMFTTGRAGMRGGKNKTGMAEGWRVAMTVSTLTTAERRAPVVFVPVRTCESYFRGTPLESRAAVLFDSEAK